MTTKLRWTTIKQLIISLWENNGPNETKELEI